MITSWFFTQFPPSRFVIEGEIRNTADLLAALLPADRTASLPAPDHSREASDGRR